MIFFSTVKALQEFFSQILRSPPPLPPSKIKWSTPKQSCYSSPVSLSSLRCLECREIEPRVSIELLYLRKRSLELSLQYLERLLKSRNIVHRCTDSAQTFAGEDRKVSKRCMAEWRLRACLHRGKR